VTTQRTRLLFRDLRHDKLYYSFARRRGHRAALHIVNHLLTFFRIRRPDGRLATELWIDFDSANRMIEFNNVGIVLSIVGQHIVNSERFIE
jgi:hypothetical protein